MMNSQALASHIGHTISIGLNDISNRVKKGIQSIFQKKSSPILPVQNIPVNNIGNSVEDTPHYTMDIQPMEKNTVKRLVTQDMSDSESQNKIVASVPEVVKHIIKTLNPQMSDEEITPFVKNIVSDESSFGNKDDNRRVFFSPDMLTQKLIHNGVPTMNNQEMGSLKVFSDEVKKNFPFSIIALDNLKDLNYRIEDISPAKGMYIYRGSDAYILARQKFPEALAEWIGNKLVGQDNPTILMPKDQSQWAQENIAHEMLHRLFDISMGLDNPNQDQANALRDKFLYAWNHMNTSNNDIYSIDSLIGSHPEVYDQDDRWSSATERFAYLGMKALTQGVEVIPEELRPFYEGILDFSKKQVQVKNPSREWNIMYPH